MPAESSEPTESPFLDAELALTDTETESDNEGQAGSNPGDAIESQTQSSHVVHVGPNLELMDLEATNASPLQNPEQLYEEFTTTDYQNVQENLKLLSKDLVIPDEPTSSTGTLSSLQNLNKELSFTDQFFWKSNRKKNQGKPMLKQRFSQWSRSSFIKIPPRAEDVPVEEPTYNKEEENLQRALELSLKEQAERT
nr:hypothetical protein [Tanacetum cinerariifolium]